MSDEPVAAMRWAAEIVRANHQIAADTKLLGDILSVLRRAIMEEREACAAIAETFEQKESTNRPQHSVQKHGTLFTIGAVAVTIGDRIKERPAP